MIIFFYDKVNYRHMFAEELLTSEKLVLYALARFPLYNDRELSDIIPINMSTLTAIRNRLQRRGYINTIRFPRMDMINAGIIFAWRAELHSIMKDDARRLLIKEMDEKVPDAFYSISDTDSLFTLGFANDFTSLKDEIGRVHESLSTRKILRSNSKLFMFPSRLSTMYSHFDTSYFLFQNLDIERLLIQLGVTDRKKIDKILADLAPAKRNLEMLQQGMIPIDDRTTLRKKEKRVLYGLIKYPAYTDERIARAFNVTRQLVSRLRKDFENKNIICTLRIPDLKNIGVGILAVLSIRFDSGRPEKELMDSYHAILDAHSILFSVFNRFESLFIFPCRDFSDYKRIKYELFGLLNGKKCHREEPEMLLLSIPSGDVLRKFNFTPYLENTFDIVLDEL